MIRKMAMESGTESSKNVSKEENEKERINYYRLFESVEECPDELSTIIEGTVPQWISGVLVRNGPGKFEFGEDKYNHWFDGSSILQRFTIKDGGVSYLSRFLQSETYKKNLLHQRICVEEFGTMATPDPCASFFSRVKSNFFENTKGDNCNVNIFKFGDILLATTDSDMMKVVGTDLSTEGEVEMSRILSLHVMSAHSHMESDGTIYFIGSSFSGKPKHHIIKVPAPQSDRETAVERLSKAKIHASIPSRTQLSPSYTHSFGMTENYFIYCETPFSIDILKVLTRKFTNKTMNMAFVGDPQAMALFHVIKKKTGEVLPVKFQVKGLFFFHTINSYEEDEHIVMDVVGYENFNGADFLSFPLEEYRKGNWEEKQLGDNFQHYPARLVLPLHNGLDGGDPADNLVTLSYSSCTAILREKNLIDVKPERLLPEGRERMDLPQINYWRCNGKKYRYFYGTGAHSRQYFKNAIGKVDVMMKSSQRWIGTSTQYLSEPVFLRHPSGQDEDDGVVLSTVTDTDPQERDFLLILDAKTFTEIARAYVPENVNIPMSFHGSCYEI